MLQKAPISFTLSLCMSAGNRSLTTEQMYMKFGIEKLHSLLTQYIFGEVEQQLWTLHGDLFEFCEHSEHNLFNIYGSKKYFGHKV